MPPRLHCRLTVAAMLILAAGALRAELVKNSPFLPPQNAASTPSSNAPIQYIGWMETDEGRQYRIFDPARKVGVWLKVNERDSNLDVLLKQHDDEHDTLTVEHGGQPLTLSQRVSKVVSSGPASAMMSLPPPQPMPNVSPAVTQSVVLNPTPADEQRRLEAVAAEVARRRALREQAQQQINQGAMPPVAVPQVQPMTRQQLQQQAQQQQQQQGGQQQGGGRQRGNRQR